MYDETKLKNLEEQLAYLRWRKQTNQHMMKGTIDRTRQMQERDQLQDLSIDRLEQRNQWRREIIRDELEKPLQVSASLLREFEEKQVRDQERHHQAMVTHLDVLSRVKAKAQTRQQLQVESLEKSIPSVNRLTQRVDTSAALERVAALRTAAAQEGKATSYPRHRYLPDRHSPPWRPSRYNVESSGSPK